MGLFEVVRMTNRLRDLIMQNRPVPELREEARRQDMVLLADAGVEKVREGATSLEEVLAVCMSDSEQ